MKKTFQLQVEGKHPERLLEAIKHELRKYLKRERRRVLPEGIDFWDFDCKFGTNAEAAEVVHLNDIIARIDAASNAKEPQFYVEILAKHGVRAKRAVAEADARPSMHGDLEGDEAND